MATVLVAVALFGAVGPSSAAWASDAGKKVQVKKVEPYRCVLEVGSTRHRDAKITGGGDGDDDGDDGPTHSTHPTHPGDLVVEIPPVVIARVHGKRLVVTTNTFEAPDREEAMYYVVKGNGGLAPENIRHLVLSNCTTRRDQ